MPSHPAASPRRTFSLTGVITVAGGLGLLVWVVLRVGVAEIVADVRQVGWGLAVIIAFGMAPGFALVPVDTATVPLLARFPSP